MYHTILFDLDGTLTDPGEGITNSVAYALGKWEIHVKNRAELREAGALCLARRVEDIAGLV